MNYQTMRIEEVIEELKNISNGVKNVFPIGWGLFRNNIRYASNKSSHDLKPFEIDGGLVTTVLREWKN